MATQTQQELALLKRYHKDIPLFARSVFGMELRPKQVEFCEAFQNNKRITFRGGVGFGKTTSMALIFWWSLLTHNDVKVTIFGPGEGQIKSGIWNEIGILYGKMNPWFKAKYTLTKSNAYRTDDEPRCFGETRLANKDNVETARGIHAPNNFVFVDEATGVPDEVFAVLDNIFTDPNAKLCLVSNPSVTKGFFYETWENPNFSDLWTKVHGKMRDNPNITDEKYEEAVKAKGGVGSRDYRVMILGEFPLDSEDGIINRYWLTDAVDAHLKGVFRPSNDSKVIWGLDPAGPGRDRSVLVARHDNTILAVHCWPEAHGQALALHVHNLFQDTPRHLRPVEICVDAIGWGMGPAEKLEEMGLPVRKINVSESPTRKPDKFARMRDQLWWECREWFESGKVAMPEHAALMKELCLPTYTYTPSGKVKVESKEDIRKKGRASPDHADALCLTFASDPITLFGKWAFNSPIHYDLAYLE